MTALPGDTRSGLPRSYQRSCLLILLTEGSSHGYDLLEKVRQAGLLGADAGGLYRCLRSMEEGGLVSSWWEPSQAGPLRRTYELSAEGEEAAKAAVEALTLVRSLLDGLLFRYRLSTVGTGS